MSTENLTQVLIDIKENGADQTLISIRQKIEEMYDLEFYATTIMCVNEIVKLISGLKNPHDLSIYSDTNDNTEPIYLTCSLEDSDSGYEPSDIKSRIDSILFDNFSNMQIDKYLNGNVNILLLNTDPKAEEILLKKFLNKKMYTVLKKFNLEEQLPEKEGSKTKLKI